jgi:hypothetical protein
MRLGPSLRGALAALALVLVTGCGDGNSGPSCRSFVVDELFVNFPIFAPGATVPFAEAQVRQAFLDFDDVRCGAPFAQAFLRFAPLAPLRVRFGYRMDFVYPGAGWFFTGDVQLLGGATPTNEVFVSDDPFPITDGRFTLRFTFFEPF